MRFHNITKDDMLNGDGLRTVLWLSGCTHACLGCHNPITWDLKGGIPFDTNAKKELFETLKPDYIDGITLSGGDPFHPENREDVYQLVKEIRNTFPNKTVWSYTGFLWEEIYHLSIIPLLDVIVDGKFIQALLSPNQPWVGSSNQRVIDVQATLKQPDLTPVLWKS